MNHLKIISPCYNTEKWINNTLDSVLSQTYTNYEWIILDDLSTDQTCNIIEKRIKNLDKVKLIKNTQKRYPLGNIYKGIELANPTDEDIIIIIDGDDWFADKTVLDYVNEFYLKENCLITYGSFLQHPEKITHDDYMKPYPDHIINSNTFRDVPWKASHLRTFKYKLWNKIKKKDLLDPQTGDFYAQAGDLASTYPMLEMAGDKSRHISKILYIYNTETPLNEMKIHQRKQLDLAAQIMRKPKYTKLENSWHLKVPKKAFFYWGAPKLPFLRFMTLYSFRKMNPKWEMILYKPEKLSNLRLWKGKQFETNNLNFKDYTNKIKHLKIKIESFNFENIQISNETNEIHKSDFLRYHLLHTQGGIWSDMDILFTKPMEEISVNDLTNKDREAFVYKGKDEGIKGHAIGLLMGTTENTFFKNVYEKAKIIYQQNQSDYQGYGANLLNEHFSELEQHDLCNLDRKDVYAFNENIEETFFRNFNPALQELLNKSIGVHWYGGHVEVEKLLLELDESNYMQHKNQGLIVYILKKYFQNIKTTCSLYY